MAVKAKLTDEHRTFVVQRLAMYDAPSVVRDALKEEFGVEITSQSVEGYDPTKRAGRTLAQKWVEIFHDTRRSFVADTAAIGVANRAVRLRMLERMAIKAEKQGNIALAAQLLKQAAEEVGDVYTNKRMLDGTLQVNHDHRVLAIASRVQERRAALLQQRQLPAPEAKDGRLDS